jgi:hypothetical protein
MSCSWLASSVVIAAGVSLERTLLTVTVVLRGGGSGGLLLEETEFCPFAPRAAMTRPVASTITCRRIVKVMDEDFAGARSLSG